MVADVITVGTVELTCVDWISQGMLYQLPVTGGPRLVFVVHIGQRLHAITATCEDALLVAEREGQRSGLEVIDVTLETFDIEARADLGQPEGPLRGEK